MKEVIVEKELLDIISRHPTIAYYEIVEKSAFSPTTINKALTKLRSKHKVGVVDIPGSKARGWKVLE